MQEDTILTYRTSNMVLAIHSNTSYLSKPESCSRAGGHMFMAGKDNIPFNNGAILNILQIIQAVMSSAAEAELGALFINAKNWHLDAPKACGTWPPTTMHTNANQKSNSTCATHQQNLTRSTQGHGYALPLAKMPQHTGPIFLLLKTRHTQNLADYFTKDHPTSHHKPVCPTILMYVNDPLYTTLFKKTTEKF